MKALGFILLACTLSACGPTPQKQTPAEITGTQTERVTRATVILAKYFKLPRPLLDAHMAEVGRSSGIVALSPSASAIYFSTASNYPPSIHPP